MQKYHVLRNISVMQMLQKLHATINEYPILDMWCYTLSKYNHYHFKGALYSFEEDILAQNFDIYNICEVIIQTNISHFHKWITHKQAVVREMSGPEKSVRSLKVNSDLISGVVHLTMKIQLPWSHTTTHLHQTTPFFVTILTHCGKRLHTVLRQDFSKQMKESEFESFS